MTKRKAEWCYAAVDPSQPGAAFAVRVDDGEDLAGLHKSCADWAKRGAVPTRMPLGDGVAMLDKWVRPQKRFL